MKCGRSEMPGKAGVLYLREMGGQFCPMIFIDTYRKYFEWQAENHPALLHSDTRRVFQMVGIEEAMGDFRTGAKEKDFILRGINYYYTIGDDGGHETRKYATGGFIVAKYFSNRNDLKGMNDALAASEQVMDEIIEKIIADSKNGHPLWGYSLNSRQQFAVQDALYVGDGCYAGRRCIFPFNNFWRNCITHADAPAWLDDGVTPKIL